MYEHDGSRKCCLSYTTSATVTTVPSTLCPEILHPVSRYVATDLNPASYKYLEVNARNNHCPRQRLHCYNMDGRWARVHCVVGVLPLFLHVPKG